MHRYITQQVVAEQRDAVTRKVQEMFPEIKLPQLKQTLPVPQRQDGTAAAAPPAPSPVALFQEGQRLYGEQRFSEAAERWGRAALLQHGPSHAHLSDMLSWGRPGVAKDENRAFELARAGAALGCSHSKGALGRCYLYGSVVAKDVARGLALGRESAAAGSSFGQFVVGKCYHEGWGVAQDCAQAVQLYRLAAAQGHPSVCTASPPRRGLQMPSKH